jgi:hypothetical protein
MKFLTFVFVMLFAFGAMALTTQVNTKQRQMRVQVFAVDGTGTPALSGPDSMHGVLSKSATGTFTITHVPQFVQVPISFAQPVAAACKVKTLSESATATSIVMADLSDTAKDCDFNLFVIGSDVADKY